MRIFVKRFGTGLSVVRLGFCISVFLTPLLSSGLRAQNEDLARISRDASEGKFALALQDSDAALKHSPQDPRIWTLRGIALAGLDKPKLAIASYDQALKVSPDYLPALKAKGQLEYSLQDANAANTLDRVVSLEPTDQIAHAMLGEIGFEHHDCEAAVKNFEAAQQVLESRPDAKLQWSSCLVERSEFDAAVSLLKPLFLEDPTNELYRYDLALAYWKARRLADAQRLLEPTLSASTPNATDLRLLALILDAQGNTVRALELLQKAITFDSKDEEAYLDFISIGLQREQLKQGLDVAERGLLKLPNSARLYFARGVIRAQIENSENALADFDSAQRLDPGLSFVGTAKAVAQSQFHHLDAAEKTLRDEVKLQPNDGLAWYLFAEALSQKRLTKDSEDYQELVYAAHKASILMANRPDAHDLLAATFMRYDEPSKAAEESRAALAIDPKDPQALYELLMATRKTGPKEQVPELVRRLVAARSEKNSVSDQTLEQLPVHELENPTKLPHLIAKGTNDAKLNSNRKLFVKR